MGAAEVDFTNRDAFSEESDTGKVELIPNEKGHFMLKWVEKGGISTWKTEVELQRSGTIEFTNPISLYKGTDPASLISGLPEGDHYFRIKAVGEEKWSKPLKVNVKFISKTTLFLLLSLGGVVALATIVAIVAGYLGTRGESDS